jgi:uncharacterized protein (PEP-CTERM system associated)
LRIGAVIAQVVLVAAAMLTGAATSAGAQTIEYFGTPWIYEPMNLLPGQSLGTGPAGASLPTGVQGPTAYSNLFGFATQIGDPVAPAWQFTPRFGVNEIATDNVEETYFNRQADLTSQLYGGFLIGADTSHLTGILDYTGVFQKNINDTDLDHFSNFAFLSAHATIIPGAFLADIHGSIDDVLRTGGGAGLNDTVLGNGEVTQSYLLSASPYYVARIGDIGFATLRYQIAQAWFSGNTGAISIPGANLGPVDGSTQQQLRLDIKMPGTLLPRLATHIALDAGSEVTGRASISTFLRSTNEVINEYQLTRSLSIIGAGGWEWLRDQQYPLVVGQGATWDFGGRWQPNFDSSILIVYGHHDLHTDIAGEVQIRLTPFTSFYAAYTDSIGTGQQSLIASNDASLLNPAGAVSGVTFDQSPILATLNDAALASAGDLDTTGVPLGVPLADVENFSPLQNDILRTKLLRGTLYSNLGDSPISLTAYNSQQISLAFASPPETTTRGAYITWSPTLSPDLYGYLQGGINYVDLDHGNVYNAAIGSHYTLSPTLAIGMRYDFIYRTARPYTGGYIQNALTISLNKNL